MIGMSNSLWLVLAHAGATVLNSKQGVFNKSPGSLPGFLPGRYKIQVVLTVKYRIPDNLLLPGNIPGAKMDPGILPCPTAMHPGTTTIFFSESIINTTRYKQHEQPSIYPHSSILRAIVQHPSTAAPQAVVSQGAIRRLRLNRLLV